MTGADALTKTLAALGIDRVFGVPGTQNVAFYEALRRGRIRAVLTTHELGAAFMANGYARASGRPAAILTIPGPGFTYALTGVAEARHDSVPLLHLIPYPRPAAGRRFELQAIDHAAIAAPLYKAIVDIESASEIRPRLVDAHRAACAGEPGPVLVRVRTAALSDPVDGGAAGARPAAGDAIEGSAAGPRPAASDTVGEAAGEAADDSASDAVYAAAGAAPRSRTATVRPGAPGPRAAIERAAAMIESASRPLVLAGQGAADAAAALRAFAERIGAPVLTTPSGRGTLPEDHPLALGFDYGRASVDALNELIETCDVVVALGCKLGHNGTVGFRLRLPADRLIHVNTDPAALDGNYPAAIPILARVEDFLGMLPGAGDGDHRPGAGAPGWEPDRVAAWRERLRRPDSADPEPAIEGVPGRSPAGFFSLLRRALPRDAILVTDSGLHQMLARRHFDVLAPRGLIAPSDFQSMGFGIPAAIGAAFGAPGRRVVAVVGDGGLAMAGLELLTAAREGVAVTIVVFNDGKLNLIRLQQFSEYGRAHAVELRNPELDTFAAAVGAAYVRIGDDAEGDLRRAVRSPGPALVEVLVGDSARVRALRARSAAREAIRAAVGPRIVRWLKRRIGR